MVRAIVLAAAVAFAPTFAHADDYFAKSNESSTVKIRQDNHRTTRQRIAIYSHTGAICFLTLHLMGAIRRDTRQTPWIVTSNCGINRFEIRGRNNVRVLALNDTRHLSTITGNDAFAAG